MRSFFAKLGLLAMFFSSAAMAAPTVTSVTPTGEIKDLHPQITITFSEPMVEQDQVNKQLSQSPVYFSPKLKTTARWEERNKLVVDLTSNLNMGTEYRFDFGPKGIRNHKNQLLAGTQSFSFSTPPLKLESLTQAFAKDNQLALDLNFNGAFTLSRLYGFLTFTDEKQNAISYKLATEGTVDKTARLYLTLDSSPKQGQKINYRLSAGLRNDSGTIDGAEQKGQFAVDFDMNVLDLSLSDNAIQILLNQTPEGANLKDFIQLSPNIDYNLSTAHNRVLLYGNFEPRSKVTVTLKAGFGGKKGLKNDYTGSLVIPDKQPSISFNTNSLFYVPQKTVALPLTITNIDKLTLRAERVYDENLNYIGQNMTPYRQYSDLCAEAKVQTYRPQAPLNKPFECSVDLSDLGELKKGVYFITAESTDEDWGYSYDERVINITNLLPAVRTYPYGLQVWVSDATTGKPVSGATLELYSTKNLKLTTGTTDTDGLFSWTSSRRLVEDLTPTALIVRKGDDTAVLPLNNLSSPLALMENPLEGDPWPQNADAQWYTPRSLYRPGEELSATLALRSPQNQALADHKVVWKLALEGTTLNQGTVTTDADGIATVTAQLSHSLPTGTLTLQGFLPGSKEPLAIKNLQLGDFVPPTITVNVKAPKLLNNSANHKINIESRYLFNAPAEGLNYDLTCLAVPVGNYAPKSLKNFTFTNDEKTQNQALTLQNGKLDKDGKAVYSWNPEVLKGKFNRPVTLKIKAEVEEEGGRRAAKTVEVPWFPSTKLVGLESNLTLTPQSETVAKAVLTDPDGQMQQGTAHFTLSKVTAEWIALEENGQDRSSLETIKTKVWEKDLEMNGITDIHLPKVDQGRYLLEAQQDGQVASLSLECWNSSRPASAAQAPGFLSVTADKASYQASEKAQVTQSALQGDLIVATGTDRPLTLKRLPAAATLTVEPAQDAPNLWLTVSNITVENGLAKRKPGLTTIVTDQSQHKATVHLDLPKTSKDEKLTVNLTATANQKPLNGTALIYLVDQGLLFLNPEDNQDPYQYFSRIRDLGGMLLDAFDMASLGDSPRPSLKAGGGLAEKAMRLANFDGMAAPFMAFDHDPICLMKQVKVENGKATVDFALPSFRGGMRVEALVFTPETTGRATAQVVRETPLDAQITAPRAVAPNDLFSANAQIFTLSDGPVTVTVETLKNLSIDGSATVQTKAVDGKALISLPKMKATAQGEGSFRLILAQGDHKKEITHSLTVRPSSSPTTWSGVGFAEKETKLDLPDQFYPQSRSVSVTLSGAPFFDLSSLSSMMARSNSVAGDLSDCWKLILANKATGERESTLNRSDIDRLLTNLRAAQGPDGLWDQNISLSSSAVALLAQAEKLGFENLTSNLQAGKDGLTRLLRRSVTDLNDKELNQIAVACLGLTLADAAPEGVINWLQSQKLSAENSAIVAACLAKTNHGDQALTLLGAPTTDNVHVDSLRLLAYALVDPTDAKTVEQAHLLSNQMKQGWWMLPQGQGYLTYLALSNFNGLLPPAGTQGQLLDGNKHSLVQLNKGTAHWQGDQIDVTVQPGDGPIWYSWSITGIPKDAQKASANGIKLSADWGGDKFKKGEKLTLTVNIESAHHDELWLTVPIAGGFEFCDEPKLSDGASLIRSNKRFDRQTLLIRPSQDQTTVTLTMRALFCGQFEKPQLSVFLPDAPSISATTDSGTIQVLDK